MEKDDIKEIIGVYDNIDPRKSYKITQKSSFHERYKIGNLDELLNNDSEPNKVKASEADNDKFHQLYD